MKEYNLKDYTSFIKLKEDMLLDLNTLLQDVEFTSNKFTNCEVLEVVKPYDFNNKADFIIEISVLGGIKQLCLRPALEQGTIVFSSDINSTLTEMFIRLDKATEEYNINLQAELKLLREKSEREYAERQARIAAYEVKKAELKAKEKFEAKIKRAQDKFESDIKSFVRIEQDPIDWLKENTISITATIPSHLEKIFVKVFGDVPHKTVDSNRTTSGGYSMKFGPSFMLTVKKGTTVHPQLAHLFKENKINDTKFISRLITHHDFKFGKNE